MTKPSTWDGLRKGLRGFTLAALMFALLAASAAPAFASKVQCNLAVAISITPGITPILTPQSSVGTGSGKCKGALNGSGDVSFGTSSVDDCLTGSGSGTFITTVISTKGQRLVGTASGAFTFVRNGTTGTKITITGGTVVITKPTKSETLTNVSGTLDLIPVPPQNCFTIPITAATVSGFVKGSTM